jgi:hypothetical protein
VKCPLVNKANIVPQYVGSMTVEESGGERHTLQIGSSETRDDDLKQLFGQRLELLAGQVSVHIAGAHCGCTAGWSARTDGGCASPLIGQACSRREVDGTRNSTKSSRL